MISINCVKKFGDKFKIEANLQIPKGKIACFYGKSGSGKTTLLRLIAGFQKADSGEIINGEITLFDDKFFMPPQKRQIGFLFQDYALFENMSVIKNLLFAKNDPKKANELLNLLEILDHANSQISELSGGQKQRVALARALMQDPKILLLDEPLSALDNTMRSKIQDYLLKIHQIYKPTIIIVSHDVSEIYKLCDIVFEIENGRVIKSGTPSEVFLKTLGSQKFSFLGKIVEISQKDSVIVAVVAVGNQLCEVVLSKFEAKNLQVGDEVSVSAKAYLLNLKKVEK